MAGILARPCRRVVLVVDDDPGIRESLADVLTDEGYVIVTAAHGEEALEKLRASEPVPCAILLDLMMPVMNGAEFYAELRKEPRLAAIPVVILSADGHLRQKASAYDGEFLLKPVRVEAVLAALERHC